MTPATFPSLLHRFFTGRLRGQLGASAHTIAAYRDTFRLLFRFAASTLKRGPSALRLEDLDVDFLSRFLDQLESTREIGARTRNNQSSVGLARIFPVRRPP